MLLNILTVVPLSSCNNDSEKKLPNQQPTSKITFGMCGVPVIGQLGTGSADAVVTPELISSLAGDMKVKSFRVWMHLAWMLELDASGSPTLREDNVREFHNYIGLLKENGVENIIAMSSYYLFPSGYTPTAPSAIPLPDSEHYKEFMTLLEQCYAMIAKEFPDITFWEPGNETNAPNGAHIAKPGYIQGGTAEQNKPYLYTQDEMAAITADICYYANKGIKSAKNTNQLVFPGLYWVDPKETQTFMDYVYENITSGKLPTNRIADVNPDSYFDYLNWHPYKQGAYDISWLEDNKAIIDIAAKYGDGDKKVFITELGYYDLQSEENKELNAINSINAIEALKQAVPTIETIFIFRMFNWSTAPASVHARERTFGLFSSPLESGGIQPKPIAISLFYYFNGVEANSDPLFQYAK